MTDGRFESTQGKSLRGAFETRPFWAESHKLPNSQSLKEQESFEFYKNAVEIVKDAGARQLIDELAKEELSHKKRLENFKPGDLKDYEMKKIRDLRISDFLVEEDITEKTGFQGVLIKAMKKEQKAYEFFTGMIGAIEDKEVKKLFEILANEELDHKNRLETYYDDVVYSEN
jgi:rubrerythrin